MSGARAGRPPLRAARGRTRASLPGARLVSAIRGATSAMGTRFEIVVASDDDYQVRPVVEAALAEIEELHGKLTRFASDSLISHINRTAAHSPVKLDGEIFALLQAAQKVKQRSGGAFDIALGSGDIQLDERARSVEFERTGTSLDLGGIAKGYAIDRAGEILRHAGISSALLHGGTSSVLAIGSPPDSPAWRVALAHCRGLRYVDLCDSALSVSRPFSQLVNAKAHIIDPRARVSLQQPFLAVVIGPSACLADAWSTALAVLGRRPAELSSEYTTFLELQHE